MWLVYYKQKKYHAENKKYSALLSEINIPQIIKTDFGETINLELISTELQFIAVLNTSKNIKIIIDQDGNIKTNLTRK